MSPQELEGFAERIRDREDLYYGFVFSFRQIEHESSDWQHSSDGCEW